MTKKSHEKFWRMKNENFIGKAKIYEKKISTESGNFSRKQGGNLKRGDCIIASEGMDDPECKMAYFNT